MDENLPDLEKDMKLSQPLAICGMDNKVVSTLKAEPMEFESEHDSMNDQVNPQPAAKKEKLESVASDPNSTKILEKCIDEASLAKSKDEDFARRLSVAMSDHNYSLQEFVQNEQSTKNLKELLLNRLLINTDNRSQHTAEEVLAFVEKTVSTVEEFENDMLNPEQSSNNLIQDTVDTVESVEESPQLNTNESPAKGEQSPLIAVDELNLTAMSIPETCSEPLENKQTITEPMEEELNEKVSDTIQGTKQTLKVLMEFAKTLFSDCNNFMTATENVDDRFEVYVKEQVHKFKNIIKESFTFEKSVQTDKVMTTNKRKRLNHKMKRNLLTGSINSTDSESDLSSSSTFSLLSAKDSIGEQTNRTKKEDQISTQHNNNSDDVLTVSQDYDDGIDFTKYIESDIFGSEHGGNATPDQGESDKENKTHSKVDEIDKEIDRLTNLSGLSKRQQNGSTKLYESDKTKSKTLSQKNNNIIGIFDDEFENNSSGKSICDSEDEIITENEFKMRCNDRVKEDLLNDSSSDSDSEEFEENNDELNNQLSSDGEGGDGVDKFLENFTITDSENEETIDESASLTIKDKCNDNIPSEKEEVEDLTKENSDFDILDKNLIHKKKNKSKSLEKMLSEAEKRNNNGNEEIVLSSESEYSDVEAVDVEPIADKSRIIKAMLRPDQLANETRKAQKSETERIRKLEKKQSVISKALKNQSDKISNSDVVLDYLEDSKVFIKVDPDIVRQLKPHQIDGVKFMYECCYAGVDFRNKNTGSGCILAHCMGLGKTLQLIALIHTVVTYSELKTSKVLVLCPKSTVMNWADELLRWLGPLKKEKNLKVFAFAEPSDIIDKLNILEEWSKSSSKRAGCLLLGYEAFRTLVFYHSYKNRVNLSPERLQEVKDKIDKFLLDPGADLVVCDEGHIIKNSKSAISLAVSKIKTHKRIILTGTPIQNNLKEYYSMVNFIKPLYLGTEKEFANLYANPIKNGQHKDSGKKDIKVMKQRSFVLHKKLSKFVQRKEAELLKTFLPDKFEYVLFIPMSRVQITLYEYILEAISSRGDNRGKGLITDYTCLRKIWTHPKVLESAWESATDQKTRNDNRKVHSANSDDDQPDDIYDSQTGVMSVRNDWWRNLVSKKDLETIMPSNKMRAMFEILRLCEEKGEKCLIFSAFVAVLNVVEFFFRKITNNDPEILQQINFPSNQKVSNVWISGQDYYRLDGKTPKTHRHEMIKRFNSSSNMRARVFLISSKAGGQGINLTGANRVIILDTSWNPSNDQQNIFRIFRLGQKRNCYIYRLLAMGTMEEKVYSRSVTKQAMSFRVVDVQQIDRHYNMAELAELYTLTNPLDSERPMPILPKDSILASLLMNHPDVVYKYHEHDSLLENKVEQELSEQEKADAWATYERELQMNLESQEMPNIDRMQNNFLPKMPTYGGGLPPLDMQAIMNYGIYGPQTSSLLSTYTNAQQYMDAFNVYRNLALSYADMNAPLQNNPYPASAYNPVNNPKPLGASMPMLSNMHGNVPPPVNAFGALADFSMLGLHAPNMYNNPAASVSLHSGNAASNFPATSNLPNTNLPLNTNGMPAFGQYAPPKRDTVFPNYLKYGTNDFPVTSSPYANTPITSSSINSQNIGTMSHSNGVNLPPQIPNNTKNVTSIPSNLNSSKNSNVIPESIATPLALNATKLSTSSTVDKPTQKEMISNTSPNTIGKPFATGILNKDASTTKTYIDITPVSIQPKQTNEQKVVSQTPLSSTQQKAASTSVAASGAASVGASVAASVAGSVASSVATSVAASVAASTQSTNNTVTSTLKKPAPGFNKSSPTTKTMNNLNSNPQGVNKKKAVNMGILYPNLKENSELNSLNKISEMQIIPTTSPPGTSSISKQLFEIAPSISLTAVQNSVQNSSPKLVATTQPSVLKSNDNSLSFFKSPTNKFLKNQSSVGSASSVGGSSATSSTSITAKVAAASAVLAKASGNAPKLAAISAATSIKNRPTNKVNIGQNIRTTGHQSSSLNSDSQVMQTFGSSGLHTTSNEYNGSQNSKKINVVPNLKPMPSLGIRNVVPQRVKDPSTINLPILSRNNVTNDRSNESKSLTVTDKGMSIRPLYKSDSDPPAIKFSDRKRANEDIKNLNESKRQKF